MWKTFLFRLLFTILTAFPTIYREDKNLKRKEAVRKFLFENSELDSPVKKPVKR